MLNLLNPSEIASLLCIFLIIAMPLAAILTLANCFVQVDYCRTEPRPLVKNWMERQEISVERALVSDANVSLGWWDIALNKAFALPNSCCSWTVIRCKDDGYGGRIVNVLLLPGTDASFTVAIHFLPHTLEFFHSTLCVLQNFSLRTLPRQLRYIHLRNTKLEAPHAASSTINTADFPRMLEEAYLSIQTPLISQIVMPSLPKNLR